MFRVKFPRLRLAASISLQNTSSTESLLYNHPNRFRPQTVRSISSLTNFSRREVQACYRLLGRSGASLNKAFFIADLPDKYAKFLSLASHSCVVLCLWIRQGTYPFNETMLPWFARDRAYFALALVLKKKFF
jgi:hypothetical protein